VQRVKALHAAEGSGVGAAVGCGVGDCVVVGFGVGLSMCVIVSKMACSCSTEHTEELEHWLDMVDR
jgi:hypothetical protein